MTGKRVYFPAHSLKMEYYEMENGIKKYVSEFMPSKDFSKNQSLASCAVYNEWHEKTHWECHKDRPNV